MAINRRKCLIILAASAILLALPGCSGQSSPTAEGQDVSDVPAESQALPTATRTEIPPTAEPTEPPALDPGDQLVWDASDAFADTGLMLDVGGDVDTEAVQAGPSQDQAYRTGNSEVLPSGDGNDIPDNFMQFRIDDGFVYGGSPTARVRIEVEYLDEGTDRLIIEYDGENDAGPFGDGRFTEADYVRKTDTGEFLMAVFWVNDGYFANRDNGGDFRINDASDGADTVRRVTVTRIMPGSELASALFVNFYHDGNQLAVGQCTTLHWDVQNASDVTLNGDPVDPQAYNYVCPEETTKYALVAWNDAEEFQEEITVEVSPYGDPSTYDLAVQAMQESLGGDTVWRIYVAFTPENSWLTSRPVTLEVYIGEEKDLSLASTWYVPSFWGGDGYQYLSWSVSTDAPCCKAMLVGNSDNYPANDIYLECNIHLP